MKRILIIIGVILLIILVVVTGLWLSGRRTAQQNGTRPLSFREFITGETAPDTSGTRPDGTLGAVFTNPSDISTPDTTPSTGTTETPAQLPVTSSVFTNTFSLSPSTDTGSVLDVALTPGSGLGGQTSGTMPSFVSTNNVIIPGSSAIVLSGCIEADQNIPFTPDELSRLRGLQNRFYQVATRLHTDADASAELANYNNFKLKVDKIVELNTYCSNNMPRLTSAQMKRSVPTPFWRDQTRDTLAGFFSTPAGNYGGKFDLGDVPYSKRNLEMALRLNLW